MPALGKTIAVEAVRHAASTMSPAEFARAFGNRWTTTAAEVIPAAAWTACQDPAAAPDGPLVLGVDAPPDHTSGVIVAAAAGDATTVVELVEWRPGLAWMTPRLEELVQNHSVRSVVIHGGGPVGHLAAELERSLGAELVVCSDVEMAHAAALTYDAILERTVSVRHSPRFDDAVAGARQRRRGDAFTWARRSLTTDLSPLVALSLALWRTVTEPAGGLWVFR
jgi:hypothetical protein